MKKWILIFIVFVVVLLGVFAKVYFTAREPVKAAEKKAIAMAEKKVKLAEVNDFHLYHGLETVDVIEGKNSKGEKIIVWIPEKSQKVIVKNAKSGLSKADAIQKLMQEKNPKKIVSVRLGMEKNIPFWEIYYLSDNNLINYYYVHFQTGEWLKKIENL
ncbi:DUF5590 domain-containing protein [Bacillota bacterium Lsc_1132]